MPYTSSPEISQESLLPTEEQEKDTSFKKPNSFVKFHQTIRKPRFWKSGISILQQIIISILLIIILRIVYLQGLARPVPRSYRSFVPQINAASGPIKFEDSADWSGNTSQAASSWNKWLVNFETHTIAIPAPQIQEFGYEPGLQDFVGAKDYERFGIAMFHQLHCLATIREFAYMPDAQRMPNGKPLDHDGVTFSPFHMDHCFNYLRQAIECFADSTVEWAKIDEHGQRQGIQGWGIPHHECRDRDTLEAFALNHHNI